MVFVPTVPYVPQQQASLDAQELARDLEDAIANYQEEHPRVRQEDIQQALQLVRSGAGAGNGQGRELKVVLLGVGLTLMVVLLTIFFLAQ